MKSWSLGRVMGVEIYVVRSAIPGSLILWVIFAGLGLWLLPLTPAAVLAGSLVAVFLHWFSEVWHQLGHALAARQVGYPMVNVRLHWLLGVSIYPENEGDLPADIHLFRALGGPIASLLLSLIGVLLTFFLRPFGIFFVYLAIFFAAENFFVFCIGALIPLGFNDGSTILYWWRRRDQ
ncbi:MAG TPA: hypothetical protein ENK32_00475 [Anaerolineae bacterium]|nr:hypothetical protein [Anaerolineae bacterium]